VAFGPCGFESHPGYWLSVCVVRFTRSVRPQHELERVAVVESGLNDCQIARLTGIPRRTVLDWRHGRVGRSNRQRGAAACEHDFSALPAATYAYLLGVYLGDGHVSEMARTFRLRVFCDLLHINIAWRIVGAIDELLPGQRAGLLPHRTARLLIVSSYSRHWPCFLPQHGPGPKHERPIELVEWQRRIVDAHPDQFLRGLIHSDGCRTLNRVTVNGKTYAYPRYMFTNASPDIRALFRETCDALGVEWRRMKPRDISIAKRASVARLDEFIGPKS
jgi:hypothetical protein